MLIMFNINQFYYGYAFIWIFKYKKIENCMAKNPSKPCFLAWNPVLFLPADRKVAFVKSFFFLGWGGVGCQRPWSQQLPTTLPTFQTSSLVWCGVGWAINALGPNNFPTTILTFLWFSITSVTFLTTSNYVPDVTLLTPVKAANYVLDVLL